MGVVLVCIADDATAGGGHSVMLFLGVKVGIGGRVSEGEATAYASSDE